MLMALKTEQQTALKVEKQTVRKAVQQMGLQLVASVKMSANATTDLCCEQYHVADLGSLVRLLVTAAGPKPFGVEWRDFLDLPLRIVARTVIVQDNAILLA
jgi:hypothetical protein